MASPCDSKFLPVLRPTDILCLFEPRNDLARQIVDFNRDQLGRIVSFPNHLQITEHMIQIRLEEPQQRRGLVMIGRDPSCSIRIPTGLRANLEQCCIEINPETGIMMLCDISINHQIWLDGERVTNPPHRALVAHHTQCLKLLGATFEICWPLIAQDDIFEYESRILALGRQLRDRVFMIDPNFEAAPVAVPVATADARPFWREGSPGGVQSDGSHVKLEELGRGGFGIVWRAVVKRTGCVIAVKQMNISLNTKYWKEIQALKVQKHENIIRMFDCRRLGDVVELDLEYMPCGSVRSQMDLARNNRSQLFIHVASALEHLHAANVIHRDVKPENILIQNQNGRLRFKLADFGLANRFDKGAYTPFGTIGYKAPEMDIDEKQTAKVDVYSLGVVFLEMVNIFIPQGTHNTPAEHQMGLWTRSALWATRDRQSSFIRGMISKRPGDRPTATRCLDFLDAARAQKSGFGW